MCRIIFLLFFFINTWFASAGVIHVGKSYPVKNIKIAVGLAHPFDTIIIEKGTYKEGNIIVNKSISLLGEIGCILDGEKKFETLTLSGKSFSVKGITFQNTGYSSMNDLASIKIIDAHDFVIEDNTIVNSSFAIHIANGNHFEIKNNNISGISKEEQNTGNGIHLWKCNHALLLNNRISGHRDGIYFEFVTQSVVEKNYSTKNIRYGLHFMFSNNDRYQSNTFLNNGAGVAVMFSNHITMNKNNFEKNQGGSSYGLLLKEISDGEISENNFKENTTGIYMEGTNRMDVKKNNLSNNGVAIRIQASCSDNFVHQNNFMTNTFDVATNGSLVLNNFNSNYWDKYEGYDLNKDGRGDVPFHPLSMYAMIIEQNPVASIFLRSFMVTLLDKTEKTIPSITPENLRDDIPSMKPFKR